MTATRRLAAILAADVAGYSRLIERDESGTLAAADFNRDGNPDQGDVDALIMHHPL